MGLLLTVVVDFQCARRCHSALVKLGLVSDPRCVGRSAASCNVQGESNTVPPFLEKSRKQGVTFGSLLSLSWFFHFVLRVDVRHRLDFDLCSSVRMFVCSITGCTP